MEQDDGLLSVQEVVRAETKTRYAHTLQKRAEEATRLIDTLLSQALRALPQNIREMRVAEAFRIGGPDPEVDGGSASAQKKRHAHTQTPMLYVKTKKLKPQSGDGPGTSGSACPGASSAQRATPPAAASSSRDSTGVVTPLCANLASMNLMASSPAAKVQELERQVKEAEKLGKLASSFHEKMDRLPDVERRSIFGQIQSESKKLTLFRPGGESNGGQGGA